MTITTDTDTARVDALLDELLADKALLTGPPAEFWGKQFDLGLAWVSFPEGEGGLNIDPGYQVQIRERLAAAGAPVAPFEVLIGHGMAAPTVMTHGTEEQKKRHLRPIFTCEEVWCQLFSEPGAGSDLAGLSTSAIKQGDDWILNGQKVWTTVAHLAKWGLLVARTDPEVQKHAGLTYFIIDMEAPGVEVRPLYQITAEAEFNEVFMTDVVIPDSKRLGNVGEGWKVSLTTLMNERTSIGSSIPPRGSGIIGRAVELYKEYNDGDPVKRQKLAKHYVWAEALRLTIARAAAQREKGVPGPEGSIAKLQWAEFNIKTTEFCVELAGLHGMMYPEGFERRRPGVASYNERDDLGKLFLRSRANSIEGGTSEIMRNILAERVLGMPSDPRPDKNVPWNQIPR